MHNAPCINTSISIFTFLQICFISSTESSLASTHLLKPISWIFLAPSRLYTVICVLLCTSRSGKLLIIAFAKPKSCTIIASIPHVYAYSTSSIAFENSSFFINMFRVKFVLTFLSFAYSIAFFSSSLLKFLLFILALNSSAPKYTAFAPFCTADTSEFHSPTGDKSSILFIYLIFLSIYS